MGYEAIVPEGTHLADSSGGFGLKRALLFDDETNDLVGPPELYYVEGEEASGDEEIELRQLVAIAVVLAGVIGVAKAAPHVKQWWTESVIPVAATTWAKMQARRKPSDTATSRPVDRSTEADASDVTVADFTTAVDAVLNEDGTEFHDGGSDQRLVATVLSAAFLARHLRALPTVVRERDSEVPDLEAAIQRLVTPQVANRFNSILERGTLNFDSQGTAEIVSVFGGGDVVNGTYSQVTEVGLRKALRIGA